MALVVYHSISGNNMHLIESYALSCGAQVGSCFIEEEYIKLPNAKYITFHGYNPKGTSRQYKYWQEIIDLLNRTNNFTYKIIEVGHKHNNDYGSDTSYLGLTSYGQLAYLIKNSSLHFGFDSLPIHIASHYDKKIVAIYAHYSQNTKPYFSTHDNAILLEPDHSSLKPIFSNKDPFDQINSINPIIIYNSIKK